MCQVQWYTAVILCISNLFYVTVHLNSMLQATYTILHDVVIHDCL
jgi:hypothetical protein